jgi:glycyl-tRNA synthetase beta chain
MSHPTPKKDLLIEIGTEELPPKSLQPLSQAFVDNLSKGFQGVSLAFDSMESFATPQRLAVRINGLSVQQPEQRLLKKGPAKTAAFDDNGNPTQAALGFAAACQTTIGSLHTQDTDKGSFLVFEQMVAGQPAESLISNIVSESLMTLPLPKRMRWGAREDSFIRPIHWVVLIFGDLLESQIIPIELFGIQSGNTTRGHRFHHSGDITVSSPKKYEALLETTGKVIADFNKRKKIIHDQLEKAPLTFKAKAFIDPILLDQVTGLVEWPVILMGKFDPRFLELPQEALISAMQVHQKCFPILDTDGKLLPKFLIVSNIESTHPDTVIQGNERVMHARLADAEFYYRIDKEIPLAERHENLKKVVFQHGLGSLWDKSNRINRLAIRMSETIKVSPTDCSRAALLCKTDLLTQMVGEFPELQGIMGHYYARLDGESETVANAIEEHYHPRFAQDTLPQSLLGSVIALADRIDTLVGLFGVGKRPTGEKDPFALRRQAMGILRIIIENHLNVDLNVVFTQSRETYGDYLPADAPIIHPLLDFCFDRLRAWYQEQGMSARVFEAVLAKRPTNPLDFNQRILAVTHFQTLAEAESLSAANKRVGNILTKSNLSISADAVFKTELSQETEEKELNLALINQEKIVKPLLETGNYTEALKSLSTLKKPIDLFFDKVMVMVEDSSLRNNRLTLLNRLRALFLEIADISIL